MRRHATPSSKLIDIRGPLVSWALGEAPVILGRHGGSDGRAHLRLRSCLVRECRSPVRGVCKDV